MIALELFLSALACLAPESWMHRGCFMREALGALLVACWRTAR